MFFVVFAILPFAFGLGQRAYVVRHEAVTARLRPTTMAVVGGSDALRHTLTGVRTLAQQSAAGQRLGPGEHLTVVGIETARLQSPSPKFSVEASAGVVDIADAYAVLVQPGDGGPTQTILAVQKDRRSIRAFLPPSESDSYLVFVILFRQSNTLDPGQLASEITLRTLD